jgi:hypothetical protein
MYSWFASVFWVFHCICLPQIAKAIVHQQLASGFRADPALNVCSFCQFTCFLFLYGMVVPPWTCSAGHRSHHQEGSNIGRAEHLSLHLLGLSTLSQGTFLPVPTCIFASVLEQMSEYIVAILPEKLPLSAHHCSTSRISTSAWFQHCLV